jgi:hypothetical protein
MLACNIAVIHCDSKVLFFWFEGPIHCDSKVCSFDFKVQFTVILRCCSFDSKVQFTVILRSCSFDSKVPSTVILRSCSSDYKVQFTVILRSCSFYSTVQFTVILRCCSFDSKVQFIIAHLYMRTELDHLEDLIIRIDWLGGRFRGPHISISSCSRGRPRGSREPASGALERGGIVFEECPTLDTLERGGIVFKECPTLNPRNTGSRQNCVRGVPVRRCSLKQANTTKVNPPILWCGIGWTNSIGKWIVLAESANE